MADARSTITTLRSSYDALGAVLDLLSRHPPFSQYRLDKIAGAIRRQLDLSHNVAAVGDDGRLLGYLGWAHALPASAVLWTEDRGPLKIVNDPTGAIALTIVVSSERESTTAMIRHARSLNPGVRVYFKRNHGADLRVLRKTSVANARP